MKKHPLRQFKESPGATLTGLKALLADDVVFSSPIFCREVKGKDLVAQVMLTSTSQSATVGSRTNLSGITRRC